MKLDRVAKRIIWIFVLVIALASQVLQFPEVQNEILHGGKNARIIIISLTFIGTVVVYIFGAFRPLDKYEKLASKKWMVIEAIAQLIMNEYSSYQYNLNIMIYKKRYFSFIEPKKNNPKKKKLSLGCEVFDVVWQKSLRVDRRLKMTINQGICGSAFRSGKIKGGEHKPNLWNFTEEQEILLRDVKTVASAPIAILKNSPSGRLPKYLGVINFDSPVEGSQILVKESSKEWIELQSKLDTLANYCAKILE